MRPITVRQSAAGFTQWVQLNRLQKVTNVALAVKLSSGASLTYSVEHTFDDPHAVNTNFSIARVTTTATVNQVNHGLSVADWVQVLNAGAPLDGTFAVASVVDADNFTYTVANSGTTASAGIATMLKARKFPHAILAALTASADSNYAFPPQACRLNITSYTGGFADLTIIQGN